MSVYSGFPSSLNAMGALKEVLEERKGRGIKDDEGKKPSATSSDRLKLGEQELSKLDSEQVASAKKYWRDVSPELFQFTLEYGYGGIFSRDNLSIKHRQIATIAAGLTALGTGVQQLKFHIKGAEYRYFKRRNKRDYAADERICWIPSSDQWNSCAERSNHRT